MQKLRVGVIGTGAFAEVCHLPGLQSHPEAKVIAICGRDPARAQTLAERFNVPNVCRDHHELCGRDDIDAVTIATPNVYHADQAKVALGASKHVFCEKPLGISAREVSDVLCVAEGTGKIHQVGFTYRYLYGVRELKRRVLQGDIGDPFYVRVQFDSWESLRSHEKFGFRDKLDLAGGGILYDVGSHLFDLAAFIFGPLHVVSGMTTFIPHERINLLTGVWSPVETDDIASAWFVCGEGIHGHLQASRTTPPSPDKAYIECVGRQGALKALLSRGSVDVLKAWRPSKSEWDLLPLPPGASDGKPHCLPLMMRSFVDACLRGSLDPSIDASFHDGLVVQRAIEAVQEDSGRVLGVIDKLAHAESVNIK